MKFQRNTMDLGLTLEEIRRRRRRKRFGGAVDWATHWANLFKVGDTIVDCSMAGACTNAPLRALVKSIKIYGADKTAVNPLTKDVLPVAFDARISLTCPLSNL